VRRLLRILLNALTVVSLLLCVATVVLWVRSYWYEDAIIWPSLTHPERGRIAWSREGWLHVYSRQRGTWGVMPYYDVDRVSNDVWPKVYNTPVRMSLRHLPEDWAADFAHWHVMVLSGSLPLIHHVRRRRARSRAGLVGHCPTCGYDLRATPDRCPECGTVPSTQAAA
jgi:hypothetical protein